MSHLLSKKGDKYNVWTTVSDGYLSKKWMTEAELKSWMVKQAERDFKKEVVKRLWLFPNGWVMKDRQYLEAPEGTLDAEYQFIKNLCECKTEEEYDAMLDEKFKELTKGLPDFYSF